MGLIALELVEGRQPWVGVIEPNDVANRDLIVFQVIAERTTIGVSRQRPARRVNDQSWLVLGGIDFPELLDAKSIGLRIAVFHEIEMIDQTPAETASSAFGENRVLGE